MHALVGTDRDRPLDVLEREIVPLRQGLFDQSDPGLRAGGEIRFEIAVGPSLIGIDDELSLRRGAAYRGYALARPAVRRRASL